jgi:hypothetical protein
MKIALGKVRPAGGSDGEADSKPGGHGICEPVEAEHRAQFGCPGSLIDSEEIDAFALRGRFFYVNSGLIMAADEEAELGDGGMRLAMRRVRTPAATS